jgi:AcrR family transcriptional regulator
MTDIRTIRTKEKIKKAFILLLSDFPYEKINVTDIAERAGINRVTYYTHYCDKEELVKDIVTNFSQTCSRNAKELIMKNHFDDDPIANFSIASIIAFVDNAIENKDLLSHLSKTENVVIFTYFEKSLYEDFIKILTTVSPKKLQQKYSFSAMFLLSGFNKVVFNYVLNPKISKESFILEMKKFTKEITCSNILFTHD